MGESIGIVREILRERDKWRKKFESIDGHDVILRYAEENESLRADLATIREAATRWPRCCDTWQDSLGGMHCTECGQKTFVMLHEIQKLLGVGKDGKALDATQDPKPSNPQTGETNA